MKLSSAMFDVLNAVVAHSRRGCYADPDMYPTRTIIALQRRGLIRTVAGGNVTPALDGLRLVAAQEERELFR